MIKMGKTGVYYLIYKDGNGRNTLVGIKFPSLNSTPFIVIGGKRAKRIYQFIVQVLENYGLKCHEEKYKDLNVIELPWATGLATSLYLLAIYSVNKPLKYGFLFEKMIIGEMPLVDYLIQFINFAVTLSKHVEEKTGVRIKYPKQLIDDRVAKTVSKNIINILGLIY